MPLLLNILMGPILLIEVSSSAIVWLERKKEPPTTKLKTALFVLGINSLLLAIVCFVDFVIK